jgi:hypothetical protein
VSTPEHPPDRRAHPRFATSIRARVAADDEVIEGEVVNLSEGGVLIGGEAFPPAEQVRIELDLAERGWQAVDAEVVRVEYKEGQLAARFAEVATSGGRSAIRAFLREHLLTD